jgi:hypothetical protein
MSPLRSCVVLVCGLASLLTSSRAHALLPPCFTARTERIIDAPYDLVFDTIVDTASYPEWNPYVIEVTPDVDISVVGTEFVLTVDQPFELFHTESPEKTTEVLLPNGRRAKLVYGYNDPLLAPLVGYPQRIQRFDALSPTRTRYQSEETFCTYLLPLLPLASVQTGFWLQTLALETEAEARYQASK